jgi:uncharacterized membrane protein YhaH (DUF805 family)
MSQEDWGELERAAGTGRAPYMIEQSGLNTWLSLRGRISRSTYWIKFALPIMALTWMAMAVDALVLNIAPDHFGPTRVIIGFLTFWPGIAGAVKRLHDLGHPGWYIAVFYGGALGAAIATGIAFGIWGPAGMVVGIPFAFLALASLWYTLKIMFVRGTIGPNEYGPDPVR